MESCVTTCEPVKPTRHLCQVDLQSRQAESLPWQEIGHCQVPFHSQNTIQTHLGLCRQARAGICKPGGMTFVPFREDPREQGLEAEHPGRVR